MKRLSILISLVTLVSLLAGLISSCAKPATAPTPAAAPHPIVTVTQWTAPTGSSVYAYGLGMEDLARKYHPWLRMPCTETPGAIYNTKAIEANPTLWDKSLNLAAAQTFFLARKTLPPFDEQIVGWVPLTTHNSQGTWLVSLNPKIRTVNDLRGKKVAIGLKTQINWSSGIDDLLTVGSKLGKDVEIIYAGTTPAMQALLDGVCDAAVTAVYSNSISKVSEPSESMIVLAASGKTLYHIPFPEEAFSIVKEKRGVNLGQWVMPKGTVKDQTEDLRVFLALNSIWVKDVFPEELAYEVTKFWIQYGERLKEYHSLGKLVTREQLPLAAIVQPLHPGAVRAFEEAKIPIPKPK